MPAAAPGPQRPEGHRQPVAIRRPEPGRRGRSDGVVVGLALAAVCRLEGQRGGGREAAARDRRSCRAASSTLTVKSKTPVMMIAQRIKADPPTSTAPPRPAAAMIAAVAQATTRSGVRAGGAATGPAGMSAVIAARSARVREASAWPIRARELLLGQPPGHERGLDRVDHGLAFGLRRPERTAARRRGRPVVFRSCRHRRLPRTHTRLKRKRRRPLAAIPARTGRDAHRAARRVEEVLPGGAEVHGASRHQPKRA